MFVFNAEAWQSPIINLVEGEAALLQLIALLALKKQIMPTKTIYNDTLLIPFLFLDNIS